MSDDVDAITRLVFAYAEAIDAGDFDAVAELFADAVVSGAGSDRTWRGREQVLGLYVKGTRRYDDGTPKTRHLTTNLVVDVDEDGTHATGRSYFTVMQAVAQTLPLQPIVAGRYEDRFACVGGAWRFEARHIVVDLAGDLSQHLLFEL